MSLLKAFMMEKPNIMYATIKGTLTENDGVFSGFSDNNYLSLQQPFTLSPTTKAEFDFKINVPSFNSSNFIVATDISRGILLGITSTGNIRIYVGDGSEWVINNLLGTYTLSTNTDYHIKVKFNNNIVVVSISTDGTNWIQDIQANMNLDTTTNYIIKLGARSSTQYFNGSIDLPNSYIKIGATKYKIVAVPEE